MKKAFIALAQCAILAVLIVFPVFVDFLFRGLKMADFVNAFALPRGTICVVRDYGGFTCAFRIATQSHYKEWCGCFSLL